LTLRPCSVVLIDPSCTLLFCTIDKSIAFISV